MQPPEFWRTENGIARLLTPIGHVVGRITTRRVLKTSAFRPAIPVISVGNLTVGGSGKTPVAMSIVERLKERGEKPVVILRGYGGRLKGPVAVDPNVHTADDVGDEALLHAMHCPTWVARARAAAAAEVTRTDATVIVLDDGHQHPGIAKDLSLIVVDGSAAFGNGRIVPAGPLREHIDDGLARSDAMVIMNEDHAGLDAFFAGRLPILHACHVPGPEWVPLRARRVVAFAGIGEPERFFATLRGFGIEVAAAYPFGDHQGYRDLDITPILDQAYKLKAVPVTTAKDAVRLPPDQRQQVDVLSVGVGWREAEALDALLEKTLRQAATR
jgi:tetraacyldisaccharide 4'-kinase